MSLMNVHVNVAYDPTLGANMHTYWQTLLPAPIPSTPTFSFEMIATQMWTAGYFLGQNKFTTTVKHNNFPICQAGHDIGILIPDITIPPINLYYMIMWPFSARKMSFATSTVKFDNQPVACSQIAPIPLPMMTCGDPLTLPTAFPILNWLNTLKVGMSLTDLLMGIAQIAVSICIDALFNKLGKSSGAASDAASEAVSRSVKRQVATILGKEVAGKFGLTPMSFAKKAANSAAGFVFSSIEGNPTFKLGIGGGPAPELAIQAGGDINDPAWVKQGSIFGVPIGPTFSNTPTNDPLHIVTSE